MALRPSLQQSLIRVIEEFTGESASNALRARFPGIFGMGEHNSSTRKSNMHQAIANSQLTPDEQRERLEWANNLDPFDLSAMERKYDEKTLINIIKMTADMRQYYIPASYGKRWEKFTHWVKTWLPTFAEGEMNSALSDMAAKAEAYLADRQRVSQQQKQRLKWASIIVVIIACGLVAPYLISYLIRKIGGVLAILAGTVLILVIIRAVITWRRR